MKNCMIIVNEFPFQSGEPFLQNEIGYLCKTFDNIYIFSINADKNSCSRFVPKNVFAFPLQGDHSIKRYFKFVLSGIKINEIKTCDINLKRVIAKLYVKGRAIDTAKRIENIIKREQIDVSNLVIYSFWYSYQSLAACILKNKYLAQGNNVSAVSRAHGYDLYWERNKIQYCPYQNYMLNQLNYVFPCSTHGHNYLLNKYPWASKKIITSKLGTMDYGIGPFFNSNTQVILTCCNLIALKRIDLFAKAFVILANNNKYIKWICVGDGPERSKIEKIIRDAGLLERVDFRGEITNSEVINIYKTTKVNYFCNVSEYEGIPVSIMEALSFGIPVIATDVGGNGEIVNSNNGLLLTKNISAKQLAVALNHMLILSNEKYIELRQSARKMWEDNYSADNNYNEFCDLLNELNG